CRSRECALPSAKGYPSRSKKRRQSPAGELVDRLYPASAKGRPEDRLGKSPAADTTASGHRREKSVSDTAALREANRRSGRRIFPPYQYSTSAGVSGLPCRAHHQNHTDDPLPNQTVKRREPES